MFSFEILDPYYPLYEWQWYAIWFGIPLLAGLIIVIRYHNQLLRYIGRSIALIVIIIYGFLGLSMYLLWNYPFKRPAVFKELLGAKEVLAITDFSYKPPDSILLIENSLISKTSACYEYYCLLERPLVAFQEAKAYINKKGTVTINVVREIIQKIKAENLLPKPSSEYYHESANSFTGRIIKFETNNKQYYIVSIRTGEVSNDHYALAEFLLDGRDSLQIIKSQTFYYDIAGVEFLDYAGLPFWFETFLLVCMTLSILIKYRLQAKKI